MKEVLSSNKPLPSKVLDPAKIHYIAGGKLDAYKEIKPPEKNFKLLVNAVIGDNMPLRLKK